MYTSTGVVFEINNNNNNNIRSGYWSGSRTTFSNAIDPAVPAPEGGWDCRTILYYVGYGFGLPDYTTAIGYGFGLPDYTSTNSAWVGR